MNALRRRFRLWSTENGQMLILFAMLILPATMVVGAVAVDASVWQSERRGAQKDADVSALAGAIQLLNPNATGAEAQAAAQGYQTTNDESGNASVVGNIDVRTDCYGGSGTRPNSVSIDINHASRTFFSEFFGFKLAPSIGAHAKACAGSVIEETGLVPFQLDPVTSPCYVAGKPQFGQICGMEFGSNNGPNGNPRGLLDLQASGGHCSDATGSGDITNLITNGAPGHCRINTSGSCVPTKNGPWDDCAAVQTGNPKKVLDGVAARIAKEGACDANGDGYESFSEVVRLVYDNVDPSKRQYEPVDCDPNTDGLQISPRLITIIVFPSAPSAGNNGNRIVGFAGFYLAGCTSKTGLLSDSQLTFAERKCTVPGAQAAPVFGGNASFVNYNPAPTCGNGSKMTPCPTNTLVPTNTPPPTNTPLPTNTPIAPTATNTQCVGGCPTATNTPGGPTSTPAPTQTPGGGGNNPGHDIVYGDFVNLIVTNSEIGGFDPNTLITGVTLVQ